MKVLRHYIQQVIDSDRLVESEAETFPEVQQRFGLRGAASQVSGAFLELLLDEMESSALTLANFYTYADGGEASWQFNEDSTTLDDLIFMGDYADSLADVAIDISVNAAKSFDIDADYVHDGGDIDDPGVVEIRLSMPQDLKSIQELLPTIRRELRGTMAHEMQHSVQKMIYGTPLDSTSMADLNTHMNDPQEIDARVEETIAFLEERIDESDLDAFLVELDAYIHRYLTRNVKAGKKDPEYDVYHERMMDSHLQAYKKKLGV